MGPAAVTPSEWRQVSSRTPALGVHGLLAESSAWFNCRACETPNHHLARHCRQCGEPVSFEEVFLGSLVDGKVVEGNPPEGVEPQEIGLENTGATALSAALRYLGMLVLSTRDGGLIILSAVDPSGIASVHLVGQTVISLSVDPCGMQRMILAVTDSEVLLLTLLPSPEVHRVMELPKPGRELSTAWLVRNGAVVLVNDAEAGKSRLEHYGVSRAAKSWDVRLLRTEPLDHPVSLCGHALPDSRVIFHSKRRCYVFDAEHGRLDFIETKFDLHLTGETQHAGGRVFVHAADDMAVINLRPGGSASKLSAQLAAPFKFSVDERSNRIFVADLEGLKVVDALSGEVKWNYESAYGAPVAASFFAPLLLDGAGVVFAGTTPGGETRLLRVEPKADGRHDVLVRGLPGNPLRPMLWPKGLIVPLNRSGSRSPVLLAVLLE